MFPHLYLVSAKDSFSRKVELNHMTGVNYGDYIARTYRALEEGVSVSFNAPFHEIV